VPLIKVDKKLALRILRLAAPLILSTTGFMFMQFIDAMFLSWYSPEALAAVVPAGMASYLLMSFFQGTAQYTSTFVAHYVGAKQPEKAFAVVWQGNYFSLAASVLVFFAGRGGGR
jgi:MATE family multidrug resistance protein